MDDHWGPVEGYPYFEMNDEGVVRSTYSKKVYGKWDDVKTRENM